MTSSTPDEISPKISNCSPNEDDDEIHQNQDDHISANSIKHEPELNCELNDNNQIKTNEQSDLNQNPLVILKKLEIIKDIKIKTSELERIKSKLIEEVDIIETEAKTLESYESELDALIKEKLEQMEILRQIQDDIQTMENTIKQTIEEKKRSVQNAIQLHVDYEPLKHQINDLRESVGLDKLNDNLDISILENYLE
ncbi:unnamed protein product [Brachionus calyciflorus]|uniref:Uncharacterized protein n=1 Tax=Brachionus calyciflorus TaxID=104777 RepID=A0A813RG24_9BILA|nr:unnamed protein product [Brachionus calyciflorus]